MFLSSPLFLILSYIILKKTVRSFNASRLKLRISLPSHKPNKRITNVSFLQFIFYVSSFWGKFPEDLKAYFIIDKEKKDDDKDGSEKEKEGEKSEEKKEGKF